MAAEAVIIELLGNPRGRPIRYTCADGTAIAKGAICKITDPRTTITMTGIDNPIAGIAAAEKVANDGSTTISVYTDGIFDITAAAAGAQDIGKFAAPSATVNMFTAADAADLTQNSIIGYLMEAADNDETVAVRVDK
ncbi:MAG: hypothetical protein PHV93_04720 [Candidatus Pacebacteria bacterium]|nr:hypothetical protein [Candidatus Paceibacterota bacterium]